MAVQTVNVAPSNASTAAFRAWGSAISAAIAAAGLTKTTDTGQINWATVNVPGVANTSAGFEIWQFTDALQATAPVFIRLDYGTGGVVANPQISVTIGTATNGTGTIAAAATIPNSTLPIIACGTTAATSWGSATASNIWVDSDAGSSLMIAGWVSAAGAGTPADAGILCVVERSRNFDGTPNGNGVMAVTGSATGGNGAQEGTIVIAQAAFYNAAGGYALMDTMLGLLAFSAPRSAVEGATTFVFPVFCHTPHMNAYSKHLVAAFKNDIAANVQFSVLSYGVAHTYNSWGPNAVCADASAQFLGQLCFRVA